MQLLEQLKGHGRGDNEFAFRQFQNQRHRAWREGSEELTAVVDQCQVLAMVGGDVDANMEQFIQVLGMGREQGGGLAHQ
ncbi:hypothetical protein D3C75_1123650 [compost metagenome]